MAGKSLATTSRPPHLRIVNRKIAIVNCAHAHLESPTAD